MPFAVLLSSRRGQSGLGFTSTSRTGGQPSWRRRLGWRKGSIHGSTGQLQFECSPFHRGAVDFFELAELLACRPIREQAGYAIAVCSVCQYEACSRLVTGAVDDRRLAQRCALRGARGYEVHESRQSRGQSRRRR